MKRYPKIEGILHDVSLSLVSQKYIDKHMAGSYESVEGAYVPDSNLIYTVKTLSESTKIHTVLHEMYHMFEHHTERMDTEAKADSFAAWIIRIFNPKSVEELLKK